MVMVVEVQRLLPVIMCAVYFASDGRSGKSGGCINSIGSNTSGDGSTAIGTSDDGTGTIARTKSF